MLPKTQIYDNANCLVLYLHPQERVNDKTLLNILAFKACTVYMGNLNNMFTKNFRERYPPALFNR